MNSRKISQRKLDGKDDGDGSGFMLFGGDVCKVTAEKGRKCLITPEGRRILVSRKLKNTQLFNRLKREGFWMAMDRDEVDSIPHRRLPKEERYHKYNSHAITVWGDVLLMDDEGRMLEEIPLERLVDTWIMQQITDKNKR